VSILTKIVRRLHSGAEYIALHRIVVLPFQPTLNIRLDLRVHRVEPPRELAAGTVRTQPTSGSGCDGSEPTARGEAVAVVRRGPC
jgi:hypothetical protein